MAVFVGILAIFMNYWWNCHCFVSNNFVTYIAFHNLGWYIMLVEAMRMEQLLNLQDVHPVVKND